MLRRFRRMGDSGKLSRVAQMPEQRSTTDDGNEEHHHEKQGETGFHSYAYLDCASAANRLPLFRHILDAPRYQIRELGFAFLAEKITVIGCHRLKVLGVFRP